jgi:hypothetical protein
LTGLRRLSGSFLSCPWRVVTSLDNMSTAGPCEPKSFAVYWVRLFLCCPWRPCCMLHVKCQHWKILWTSLRVVIVSVKVWFNTYLFIPHQSKSNSCVKNKEKCVNMFYFKCKTLETLA